MIDFFIKVKQQEAQHLPFVIYSKPNKNTLVGLFQKNDHLYFAENFTERGFVFAPFDGNQMILIPKEQSVKWEAELIDFEDNKHVDVEFLENKEAKVQYMHVMHHPTMHQEKCLLQHTTQTTLLQMYR